MLLLQRHQLVEHLVGRIFTLEAYHHEIAHPAPPVPCATPIQTNRTTATSFYHLCDPLCNAGSSCLHRLSGRTSGRPTLVTSRRSAVVLTMALAWLRKMVIRRKPAWDGV